MKKNACKNVNQLVNEINTSGNEDSDFSKYCVKNSIFQRKHIKQRLLAPFITNESKNIIFI